MVEHRNHHRRKRQREYGDSAQLAGYRRVGGDGCDPGDVCERRVFVCFRGYGRELGVIVDSEYRRRGDTNDESGVAGGGGFGERAIRVGVCEFDVGLGVPLPVHGFGGIMGVVVGRDRRRGESGDE